MKTKFELKENVQPVFKKQRDVPFASLKQINGEFNRLEKMGVLFKVDHSDWDSPTEEKDWDSPMKKKSKEIVSLQVSPRAYTIPTKDIITHFRGRKRFLGNLVVVWNFQKSN